MLLFQVPLTESEIEELTRIQKEKNENAEKTTTAEGDSGKTTPETSGEDTDKTTVETGEEDVKKKDKASNKTKVPKVEPIPKFKNVEVRLYSFFKRSLFTF